MLKRTIVEGQVPQETDITGSEKKEYKFKLADVEHVAVKVKKGVVVKAGRIPSDAELPTSVSFTPVRLVINLKLTSTYPSTTFPIDLKVRYEPDDVSAAGGMGNLKLAYLDGSQWKIIQSVNWGSDYYASVTIPDFPGDPPIASGH